LLLLSFDCDRDCREINIQWVEGDYYRKLAKERTVKNFVIPANKGNIYSADGSLLATSIPNYTIRFDAKAPKVENFEKNGGVIGFSSCIPR
jgi:cell division protein FtsI (penicillin-binding protein 3)